jgi:hypothetical protein
MRRTCLVLAAAFALAGLPASALAQSDEDRATARALFFQAQEALSHNDFTAAADLFGRSDALMHAPTTSLGFARAQVGLGRLVGAHETYNRIVREGLPASPSPAFVRAVEDARAELAALQVRLPTVVIAVVGPADPVVTVDGAAVNKAALGVRRYIDPGTHKVVASARGYLSREVALTVVEGGTARAEIVLPRDPKHPPLGPEGGAPGEVKAGAGPIPPPAPPVPPQAPGSPRRTAGFVVGGVGVAGLAAFGVTGGLYLAQKGTVEAHCTAAKRCDTQGLAAVSSAKTLGVVNTVALFGGIAATGVGAFLVISSRSKSPARPVTALGAAALPGGGHVVVDGRF